MKILLVEDDVDLADITTYALRREGFNVLTATDGEQAMRRWEADAPDLLIVDVGLPYLNGFELCRRIRQRGSTPIIFLTGLDDEEHILQGFRLGGDDYITKPFSPRQLAMRIRAVLRRGAKRTDAEPTRELCAGDFSLDLESRRIRRNGSEISLTPTEFRLLFLLASNCGRVVSSSRLVEYAWGYDAQDASLLKTHISHLRKKVGAPRSGPGDIASLPGVGYKLVAGGRDQG